MRAVSANGTHSGVTTPATALAAGENGDPAGFEVVAEEPKPRALHKTASIFLRNLAPTITKEEVETVSVPCRSDCH